MRLNCGIFFTFMTTAVSFRVFEAMMEFIVSLATQETIKYEIFGISKRVLWRFVDKWIV